MTKELTTYQIVDRINRHGGLKDIAKEMGYTESTLRKRIEKDYYYSKQYKMWTSIEFKELHEADKIWSNLDCFSEINIITMERYEDQEYWKEREYNIFGEECVKEEISLLKHLDKELTEDSERLGVSKRDFIQLCLLRYYKSYKKKKGSGLEFEKEYEKKGFERVDGLWKVDVNEYMKQPLFKLKKEDD